MTENRFKIPTPLERFPPLKRELRQAWDSADELLLAYLNEHLVDRLVPPAGRKPSRILVLNDGFGAISGALLAGGAHDLTVYTDSYLSARAIHANSRGQITVVHDLDQIGDRADVAGHYDFVFARVPKNLSFFEDELCRVSALLRPPAEVICTTMVKYQNSGSFELLNRLIGATTTSLARKKARLIFAKFQREASASPYPLTVRLDGFAKPFIHYSNLFSREKLDIGTRFLLEHIPDHPGVRTILDLGCGNGVVGIAARLAHPQAQIIYADESWMAIQSASANHARYFAADAAATATATAQAGDYRWTHGYENQPAASVDLVLCNPPFHQGTSVGDETAWQMFKDARRALRPGGRLRVIGNSHLQYPNALNKIFGHHEIVAKNAKFTIVDAVR